MACKIGPDGVERNQPGDARSSEMQHQSQYAIDISTPEYQNYLQRLADIAYSMACFHGKYKDDPGFSQDCKKTVKNLYGKTPIRLQRHQIEKLQSNVCDVRQKMESSRTRRPPGMKSEDGEAYWRRIVARHRCADDALKYWLENRWLPVEGDERQGNARWWNNQRYEAPLENEQQGQQDQKGGGGGAGPMQFFQSVWNSFRRYMPWGEGSKGRPAPAPGRPPRRIPLPRGR